MSPLMQTICDELRACALDRYMDGFERDTYAVGPHGDRGHVSGRL